MKLLATERPWEKMFTGYRRIFWGILLMLFQINLGSIQILPSFVGYILIASGVGCFKKTAESRRLNRAYIVAVIIVVESLLEFMLPLFGTELFISQPFTVFIIGVMEGLTLLLFYDIFSASSEILRLNNDSLLAERTDDRLRIFLGLFTPISIATVFLVLFQEAVLVIVVTIFGITIRLWLASVFAGLKRRYNSENFDAGNVNAEPTDDVSSGE